MSRADKVGGGISIGAALMLKSGIEACRVVVASVVKYFGARADAVDEVGEQSSGMVWVQSLMQRRSVPARMEPQ